MINQTRILVALTFGCLFLVNSSLLAQNQVQAEARMAKTTVTPHQMVLNQIQVMLDEQAQLGQTPTNNLLLAELQALMVKHSVQLLPTIKVTNFGPGKLKIVKPDGTFAELERNWSTNVEVGSTKIQLIAQNQDTTVSLQHELNGLCRFWDQDDNAHTTIEPKALATDPPRMFQFTLTRDALGYHLEQ